jgi:diguanylate cyclase (GGDEF)-like protein/PAS domain S-box-containing protein
VPVSQVFKPDESAIARQVLSERVRVFTDRAVNGVYYAILATFVLAWMQLEVAGLSAALTWLCWINLVKVLVLVLGLRYRADPNNDYNAQRWGRVQIACAPLLGLAWGSSVWFFWVDGQMLQYMANICVLVAVTSISLTIVSPFASATALLTAGVVLPVLAHLLVVHNPLALQVAVGMVVLFAVQLRYARIGRLQLLLALETAVRNAALASQIKIREQQYRLLAENSQDVIWTYNLNLERFSYVSPSVQSLRGYTPEEVMAQSLEEAMTAASANLVRKTLDEQLARIALGERDHLTCTMEVDQPHRDGHTVHTEVVTSVIFNDLDRPVSLMGITLDITERKKVEQELERLSHVDMLTGLYNRRRFMQLSEHELSRKRRYGGELAVFMMDLDHFKTVNDTYGHQTGDLVLQKLGEICRDVLRDLDCVGRLGGEEFAVVLPRTDVDHAMAVAERLRDTVEKTSIQSPQGESVHCTISIGVATMQEDRISLDTLLSQADRALYQAKHEGRNRVLLFSDATA